MAKENGEPGFTDHNNKTSKRRGGWERELPALGEGTRNITYHLDREDPLNHRSM